ncbi:retrovirus-related Pol polyprotein from transposon TNT 1-94 [Trichonephila inaurata madagascariensis]|uniref:Retrovirus-related Pol polyprotein from transposon TNT 1-94 n=1 Tax=Trichonephila inaurata madagascariensis TaxID=2747483 RepID=A0A8X6XGK6_9ARAC|nr:retrovirus-related Pol polyprotein from transposon TNT 1-94 [Trichonephila inaurata madagascariensis]
MEFFRSDKELEDDIVSHIAKLQRNFRELNDELRCVVKTTLSDLLLMSRIMSTLPSEYFELKSVWESVPIEERSVNKLTERLRLIEMRLPSKSADSTAQVATREKIFKKPERKCYRSSGKKANQKLKVMLLYLLWKVFQKEVWIADSGASAHMTKHKNYFVDFTQFNSPQPVYVGNKISAEVFVALADQSLQLCHERLCHQNKAHVRDALSKYRIKSDVKDSKICDSCYYGKQGSRPFGTRKQRATTPGELI